MNADVIQLPKLKAGDLVRLVSPASFPSQSDVDGYIRILEFGITLKEKLTLQL